MYRANKRAEKMQLTGPAMLFQKGGAGH